MIDGNPGLIEAVESAILKTAIPVYTERLDVRATELGAWAGAIGAASIALQKLENASAS